MSPVVLEKKVVFLFGGTPHYYNAILNRLHRLAGYSVAVITPTRRSVTFGDAVHESTEGIEFKHVKLKEMEIADDTLVFAGLAEVLEEYQPDIIVSILPYLSELFSNKEVVSVLKKHHTKIILKDHPFRLKKYEEAKERDGLLSFPRAMRIIKSLRRKHIPRALLVPFATVVVARGRWINRRRFAAGIVSLERRAVLFRSVDAIVCYVDEAFEIFGSYGVPRERIFVTRNSPDTEQWFLTESVLRESGAITRSPQRLLHVGRLVAWKRVDLLLKAFKRVLQEFPSAELDIVGYGPKQREWETLAKNLGVDSKTTFSGGVYGSESVAKHFMEASVYVLAGMGGLSINDAMCFRLPVICSVCDGTEKHLVYDGVNGYYFREGNTKDLASKIIKVFRDPKKMKLMGQKSREIIETQVNERTVIEGYRQAFEYVLSQ